MAIHIGRIIPWYLREIPALNHPPPPFFYPQGGVSASMDPPMHGRTSPFRQPDNSMSMRSSYPAASASSPRRGFSHGGGDLNDTTRSHQSAVPSVVSYVRVPNTILLRVVPLAMIALLYLVSQLVLPRHAVSFPT